MSLIQKTLIVCVIFSFSLLIFRSHWKQIYVNTVILTIPKNDREHLSYFFHLLNVRGFPWVAKGIKPVLTFEDVPNIDSITSYVDTDLLSKHYDTMFYLHPICSRFRKGLRIWEKYSWLFPSKKIVIVNSKPSNVLPYETILILNIDEAKKVILENYQAFSCALGVSFDIDQFMDKLVRFPSDFVKILKGNHFLIGLLYGFGKDNALAFKKKEEPYTFMLPPYLISYESSNEPKVKKLKPFLELERIEILFDANNPWLRPPGFMVDPDSQETINLERRYQELFQKISKEKCGKSELKWSLLQLF
ncbi:hypothetical protein SNE_A20480 [Simkania negevensis Z]|uniref:Uncharacterized protein n=1 Tax=Simkania negevensis (strain ATCC VR-1471 / DSM 27360 / Z) TaxID=331113 RepID=F8L3R0_SIMNZ|nr:hypothetical protein SNE_A20480 [Simkania negevensis Z]